MRTAAWIVLGCLVSAPALAGTWSNLWRTADQQGEALLAAGQPARAATRFADPRLKAYADLKAGRYAKAAKLLRPFTDATSEYNRGNALARGGHLRAALAAYDAALKQAPHDRDILHNRELVARMLRHHRRKRPQHGGGKGKHRGPGKSGQGGHHEAGGTRSGKHRRGKGAQGGRHSGRGARSTGPGKGSHHGSGPKSAAPSAGSRTGQNGSTHGKRSASNGAAAQRRPRSGTGQAKHSPAEARREAAQAAAIARRQGRHRRRSQASAAISSESHAGKHSSTARAQSALLGGGTHQRKRKPVSEKTLALKQWLRQIPNNPAGLLRRKFLIQYMMDHSGDRP